MIAGDAVDPLRRGRHAANDVAPADDDSGRDTEAVHLADLVRDSGDDVRVDAERPLAHERLAGELEQDPGVHRLRRHRAGIIT